MSTIDNAEVKKIAHLARLDINDEKIPEIAQELQQILGLVEQMNQVDTDNIQPMAHSQDASLRLREDVVTEPNQREQTMALAPLSEAGLYLVNTVIE